jgi:hypothetical protein
MSLRLSKPKAGRRNSNKSGDSGRATQLQRPHSAGGAI